MQEPHTKTYLVDKYAIQLLSSSRDIIELDKEAHKTNFEDYQAYIFGYPKYNLGQSTNSNSSSERGLSSQRFWRNGGIIELIGTKKETEYINQLFEEKSVTSKLFLGEQANETQVKTLANPSILHIATHGFFLPDADELRPLERAGIILAGAENGLNQNNQDGILTAEEVITMDLSQTELVVLSACETGLGEFKNGEGVYGLQRAFLQAGAKSMIISLWKVSDEATMKMMQYFYKNWLNGQSKFEAFQNAQQHLRKEYPEPYYWAAFIWLGNTN